MNIIPQDSPTDRVEFTTDIIVIGYIATHWADSGQGACKRGWGRDLRGTGIVEGNHRWTATRLLSDKEPGALAFYGPGRYGLKVTKTINALNGNMTQKSWWLPIDQFGKVTFSFQGIEV